ncbi:MAG: alpha-amylase/4-alpha-glucanotransferase domain-containing protein [Candidatus Omnitrophota bacterium]
MKTDFAMAIHFHQPVGNFDHVFERACDKCYIPFLETLRKYPRIKMSFHFSGCLLEWAEEKRPEILEMVRAMADAGQVEIMSGGFYEPILPSIPPGDRLAQIRMLSEYVKDKFSYEAEGAWVAERVWEPELASVFYDAGIKYVILDDTHFLYSGIKKDKTYGYYLTEDNAKSVAVFPSDKVLRYYIPFRMPGECTDYMRAVLQKTDNPLFIYGDDGEKFGEWPGTHKWVHQEKWLEKFFDELMRNEDWINTAKLSECLKKRPPEGRVYLPTSSYEEMLQWALPAESQLEMEKMLEDLKQSGKEELYKPFIRGGFWRNFLEKYPEANQMNKKMVYVSRKLESLVSKKKSTPDLEEAQRDLFRGQCNCAYWHGVFGGLYLYHLRRAIYGHLIKAERAIDDLRHMGRFYCNAVISDIDADGSGEVILENRELSLQFSPAEGGALKELDSKKAACNLINSLARRKEAYHKKILDKIEQQKHEDPGEVKTIHDDIKTVDAGLKDRLNYDWYGRYSLVDHFLGKDADIGTFSRCTYNEMGNFVKGAYAFEVKKSWKGITLAMEREGLVGDSRIYLTKEVTLPRKKASFTVRYAITNRGGGPVDLVFGPEFNVTMPDSDSDRYRLVAGSEKKGSHLGDTAQREGVKKAEILDSREELSFKMTFSEECRLWHFPVRTVSQSEKAYELNYQSSALLPHLELKLESGEEKRFSVEISLT